MNEVLKAKTDLMIENYHRLKSELKWESNLPKHFAAMMHAIKKESVNIEKIKGIKQFIKDETSWTSDFRGLGIFSMASLLCFEEDYRGFFNKILEVHDLMKEKGFKRSTYLPLAAYSIIKGVPDESWDYRISRMRQFFDKMKQNHYWLTSADDYVFAAILASTELEVEETSARIEECYTLLNKEGLHRGNDLQALSHILALGEEPVKDKCTRAINLYRRLTENKCKLQYSGLATLGVLTLITRDEEKMVKEIKEVYDYIYEKDGYGFWGMGKPMRMLLASSMVADYYVDGISKGILEVTLSNSIHSIMIAQQQAAIAAMCAASAASASAASSSS